MENEESIPRYTREPENSTAQAGYYDVAYDTTSSGNLNPAPLESLTTEGCAKYDDASSPLSLDSKPTLCLTVPLNRSLNNYKDDAENCPNLEYNPRGWMRDLCGLIIYILITAFLSGFSIYFVATDNDNPMLWNFFYKAGDGKVLPKMAENVLYFFGGAVAFQVIFAGFAHIHKMFPKFCIYAGFAAGFLIAPLYPLMTLFLSLGREAKFPFFCIPLWIYVIIAFFVLRKKIEINAELLRDGLKRLEENPVTLLTMTLLDLTVAVIGSIFYSVLIYVPLSIIHFDHMLTSGAAKLNLEKMAKAGAFISVATFHGTWSLQICILFKNAFAVLAFEKIYKQRIGGRFAYELGSEKKSILQKLVRSSGTICSAAFLMVLVGGFQITYLVLKAGKNKYKNVMGTFCKLLHDCFCSCFANILEEIDPISFMNAVRHGDSFLGAAKITIYLISATGVKGSFSLITIGVSTYLAMCLIFFSGAATAVFFLLGTENLHEDTLDAVYFEKYGMLISFFYLMFNSVMLFFITYSHFTAVVGSLGLLLCEDPETCKLEYPRIWDILKKTKPTAAAIQAHET